MLIENLKDHAHFIPVIARWHFQQWGYLHRNDSVENRIRWFEKHLGDEPIPTTFVAVSGQTLFGSASLVERDLSIREHLKPWLASVFVAPEHRRQGIASSLVNRVVEEAERLGVEILYLFTPDQENLYARLGWVPFERLNHRNEDIVIMNVRPGEQKEPGLRL